MYYLFLLSLRHTTSARHEVLHFEPQVRNRTDVFDLLSAGQKLTVCLIKSAKKIHTSPRGEGQPHFFIFCAIFEFTQHSGVGGSPRESSSTVCWGLLKTCNDLWTVRPADCAAAVVLRGARGAVAYTRRRRGFPPLPGAQLGSWPRRGIIPFHHLVDGPFAVLWCPHTAPTNRFWSRFAQLLGERFSRQIFGHTPPSS